MLELACSNFADFCNLMPAGVGNSLFVALFISLCVSSAFAAVDLNKTIQNKNVRTLYFHKSLACISFFLANGVLACVVCFIAIIEPNSWVNQALGLGQENIFVKAAIIGMSVTVLARSKVVDVKNQEIGGAMIYNACRDMTLNRLIAKTELIKEEILDRFSGQFDHDEDFKNAIINKVKALTIFMSDEKREMIEKESIDLLHNYGKSPRNTVNRYLIKWALDYGGISDIHRWLESKSAANMQS